MKNSDAGFRLDFLLEILHEKLWCWLSSRIFVVGFNIKFPLTPQDWNQQSFQIWSMITDFSNQIKRMSGDMCTLPHTKIVALSCFSLFFMFSRACSGFFTNLCNDDSWLKPGGWFRRFVADWWWWGPGQQPWCWLRPRQLFSGCLQIIFSSSITDCTYIEYKQWYCRVLKHPERDFYQVRISLIKTKLQHQPLFVKRRGIWDTIKRTKASEGGVTMRISFENTSA